MILIDQSGLFMCSRSSTGAFRHMGLDGCHAADVAWVPDREGHDTPMTQVSARRSRTRKPSPRPCVFKEPFIRDQIDPRVKVIWEKATGKPAPFGRLRKAFQEEHCAKINPYTGTECPYRVEECAMAFLSGVQNATLPWIDDPAAYFVKLVASTGIDRADNKPLAREHHREEGPGHAGGPSTGHRARSGGDEGGGGDAEDRLHSARRRPETIGSLLGSLNLGPRQGRGPDGSEGTE
jgi:hypothetical protein